MTALSCGLGFQPIILTSEHADGIFGTIRGLLHPQHSYVIPSEVEGPHKCGTRHASRRGPSTTLRMTTLGMLSLSLNGMHAKTHSQPMIIARDAGATIKR